MNKKMREIKAQMEVLNEEATKLFEAKDLEGAENKLAEIANLEREYKLAEKLYSDAKEEVTEEVVNKAKVTDKVKAFATAIKQVRNSMNETTGTEGGYTVPEDVRTDIEHLKEAKKSLKDLVSVETVSTMSGKRTYKKRSSQTGFTTVGEGGTIPGKATPQFDRYNYSIKKRAGILPVTNELLEDSDANIYSEVTTWVADESRVTDNKNILAIINTKVAKKLNGLDGIKKVLNVTLGSAFKNSSKIVTNDDGLQYLDTLKDKDGKYLLSASPADPMKKVLSAGATVVPVEVFPNDDMPSNNTYGASTDTTVDESKDYYTRTGSGTTEAPYVYTPVEEPTGNPSTSSYYEVTSAKIPMTIGDLKEGIKFFDRKKLNIMASNTAAAGELNAFEEDLTLYRAIQRDDVVMRDDKAFVNGYIEVDYTETATA